jgi:Kinesin motor domain
MDESCAINKSLFVLGQVVEALNAKAARIPYRDSKITRILQDCLGGNSLSVIIACLSVDEKDSTDTYNTLNFATKASLIKNTITVNESSIPKRVVVDETANRLRALQDWKKSQPSQAKIKPNTGRLSTESAVSADGSKRSVKAESPLSTVLVDQLKKDLTAQFKKDFERQVNESVEEKLKMITDGLLKYYIV